MNLDPSLMTEDGAAHGAPDCRERFYPGLPPAAQAALETLYGGPMTTALRFCQYYPMHAAETFLAYERGEIVEAIVFARSGARIQVYNEQVALTPERIARFARAAFARYPEVRHIAWYAIELGAGRLPYPARCCACLEDYSLALPETTAQYMARLGKNMATKIRRVERKLAREVGVRTDFVPGQEAPEATIRAIVEFSRQRMAGKGRTSYHTEEETRKTIAMVRRYGVVGTMTIDGRLCAGATLLKLGDRYSLQIIGHDPVFDSYSLGILCCYHCIAHAIEAGGARFSFGWGRFEYKYRLLGERVDLVRIDLYRSRLALLADLAFLCGRAVSGYERRLKEWLASPAGRASVAGSWLRHGASAWRNVHVWLQRRRGNR